MNNGTTVPSGGSKKSHEVAVKRVSNQEMEELWMNAGLAMRFVLFSDNAKELTQKQALSGIDNITAESSRGIQYKDKVQEIFENGLQVPIKDPKAKKKVNKKVEDKETKARGEE